jgi:DinB superfamily
MGRAIEELVYLLDEAFEGKGVEETNESQSLMANLATVDDAAWRTTPPAGTRTVESVVLHVGSCKIMYDDYAFASASLTWNDRTVLPWHEGEAPQAHAIDWLTNAHNRLMAHVRTLTDEDLARLRPANWGERRETRWLLSTLLQHDAYHAGEINHIRALLDGDDAWKWG